MKLGPNIEARVEFSTEGWCIIDAFDTALDKPIPEDWLESLTTAYEEELAYEHHQWLIGYAESLAEGMER